MLQRVTEQWKKCLFYLKVHWMYLWHQSALHILFLTRCHASVLLFLPVASWGTAEGKKTSPFWPVVAEVKREARQNRRQYDPTLTGNERQPLLTLDPAFSSDIKSEPRLSWSHWIKLVCAAAVEIKTLSIPILTRITKEQWATKAQDLFVAVASDLTAHSQTALTNKTSRDYSSTRGAR